MFKCGDTTQERQRDIQALCSAPCTPIGSSALLKKSRLLYVKKTLTVWCVNTTSYQASYSAGQAIKEVVDDARSAQLQAACSTGGELMPYQYLVRQIGDQTYPTVWTILDGDVLEMNELYQGLNYYVLKVELMLMQGAAFLDGAGFPATGIQIASVPM